MSSDSLETGHPRFRDPGRLDAHSASSEPAPERPDLDPHLRLAHAALAADHVRVVEVADAACRTLRSLGDRDRPERDVAIGDEADVVEVVSSSECRSWDVAGHDTHTAVATVLAAPITIDGGHTMGALVARRRPEVAWSEADRTVLSSVAGLIAERLDTSARLAEDRAGFDGTVGSLAHDLRAPVASVTSAARLLGQLAPDSPMSARLRDVVERADAVANELVNDLVDRALLLSRGTSAVRRRTLVRLSPLLQRVADMISAGRDIEVQVHCDESVELWTDPVALHRIVQNLTDNAARHSGSDAPHILVTPTSRSVVISVIDDGRGFPADVVAWVRAADVRPETPTPHGLGLGLRTCIALAAELGGHLEVDDPPGGRVVLSLPVRAGDVDPTPVP